MNNMLDEEAVIYPTMPDVAAVKTRQEIRSERMTLFVAAFFYYSGIIGLIHWYTRRVGRRLVILNYHEASRGSLRQHLNYLRHHYHIQHLETALKDFYAEPQVTNKSWDRRIPLVMTFDDGYYDNYTHAFALAKELHVPITLFIVPGYIENGKRFWWNESKSLLLYTPLQAVTIEGTTYHLALAEEREALIKMIDLRVRYARSVGEREEFLAHVHAAFAVPAHLEQEKADLSVTWSEIREMEQSGWISFGAHTVHHPILGYLTDYNEVKREVENSRILLEQQLGHPVNTFAYPVGKQEHITTNGLRAVREAGYDWAVTTIGGVNTPSVDHHMLHRIEVNLWDHWLVMAAKTSGVFDFLLRLRSVARRLLRRK